jgi:hypothetical protein
MKTGSGWIDQTPANETPVVAENSSVQRLLLRAWTLRSCGSQPSHIHDRGYGRFQPQLSARVGVQVDDVLWADISDITVHKFFAKGDAENSTRTKTSEVRGKSHARPRSCNGRLSPSTNTVVANLQSLTTCPS